MASEEELAHHHLLQTAAYLSASSAFLSASASSALRMSKGTFDILANCSSCSAPRQFSAFRSCRPTNSRSRRQRTPGRAQPSALRATCKLCGHQDTLGAWDKQLWKTARATQSVSASSPYPIAMAGSHNPSVSKTALAAESSISSSAQSSKEASPAGSGSDRNTMSNTSDASAKKKRKKSKKEGLQALLAAQSKQKTPASPAQSPGLSSLFAQLQ